MSLQRVCQAPPAQLLVPVTCSPCCGSHRISGRLVIILLSHHGLSAASSLGWVIVADLAGRGWAAPASASASAGCWTSQGPPKPGATKVSMSVQGWSSAVVLGDARRYGPVRE